MKKIPDYKLTKEYLEQYAQSQIDIYLSTEPSNEELAWREIKEAYRVANQPEPKNIIWYDSPEAFVKTVGDSVWDSVWASVRASVWDSVRDSVRDSVGASVWASVGASVRDSVWDSVRDSVWDSVRDSVGASVWDSVRDSVWDSVRDSVGASVWAWDGAAYESWLKYFNDNQEENDFRHICYFSEQVTGYLLTAETVHAIRKPKRLVRGMNGRLHYDHDKAIEWHDGYGFYYLNGVEFDEKTFKDVVEQRVTLETLGKITNADQRAVAVQFLKPELLLKQVNAKLIHTGKKGTRLYQVNNFMDTGNTEYCIRMTHPSIKDKEFIEWVEPSVGKKKDADLCQAVAFQITKKEYLQALEA